ncbi:MAG: DUF393 domain-containing protein [Gammaproteobacteria bacterium]|nr:DUF393 domain-containing protein [Gammaproteobacteria bacterium]
MADGPGRADGVAAGLLVYDGECELCRRTVRWVRRNDRTGRLELLPYQDPAARARFRGVPNEAFEGALQLLLPGNVRYEGARAVEEVLRLLPAGRIPGLLFSLPGSRLLAGRVYGWIARNRRSLGCPAHCPRRGAPEQGVTDPRQ